MTLFGFQATQPMKEGMSGQVNWERAARATMHPLALAILDIQSDGKIRSPKDLAACVNQPLQNVSYHVRTLLSAGLLERAGRKQVRGAIQSFYVLAAEPHACP
jgi:DNA-binding transcriptional ArsR family regulator